VHNLPVCSIANLNDLLAFVTKQQNMVQHLLSIQRYRQQFGVEV
jgi:hypothetical protein